MTAFDYNIEAGLIDYSAEADSVSCQGSQIRMVGSRAAKARSKKETHNHDGQDNRTGPASRYGGSEGH
jgi:hypothetical protein